MENIKRFSNKNRIESFHTYRRRVQKLTEKVKNQLQNIELRGFNTYHIDHKKSIAIGYKEGIPADVIASLSNLQIISKADNLRKGAYGKTQTE